MMQEWNCADCGALLIEDSEEKRTPSPCCGTLGRSALVKAEDTLVFREDVRLKGKRLAEKKPFFDMRDGASYFRLRNEWHHRFRLVDRAENRYVETITRVSDGALLRHVDDPLSDHIGHGSAKSKRFCPND